MANQGIDRAHRLASTMAQNGLSLKDNPIEAGQAVRERTLTFEPLHTSNADGHESTSNKFVITVESPIITEKKVSSEDQNGNQLLQ